MDRGGRIRERACLLGLHGHAGMLAQISNYTSLSFIRLLVFLLVPPLHVSCRYTTKQYIPLPSSLGSST